MNNKIILISIILFSICYFGFCQSYDPIFISSDEELRKEINGIIEDHCFSDENFKNKIVFTLKIDSIGEIHSAHIRRADNLHTNCYYEISNQMENRFNVKYLFYRFQENIYGKYVKVNFPYYE